MKEIGISSRSLAWALRSKMKSLQGKIILKIGDLEMIHRLIKIVTQEKTTEREAEQDE